MKNSNMLKGVLVFLCTLALTGCGAGNAGDTADQAQGNPVNASAEKGNSSKAGESGGNAAELLNGCSLNGSVIEFTDSGCTINPSISEDGGQTAKIAAAGHEDVGDTVNVQYQEDCVFQTAVVDVASGNAELGGASLFDIKKSTNLVIYGDFTDSHNLAADRVIIWRYGQEG